MFRRTETGGRLCSKMNTRPYSRWSAGTGLSSGSQRRSPTGMCGAALSGPFLSTGRPTGIIFTLRITCAAMGAFHYLDWGTDAGSQPIVEQLSGLWLLNLEDDARTRLVSNRHPSKGADDWPNGHMYTDPIWSPDGTALILRVGHWEGSDIAWLDPLNYQSDEANLHDLPEQFWRHGSWTRDGQALLLSGTPYSDIDNLDRVDRLMGESERLVDGPAQGLHVWSAWDLPAGIAFVASSDYAGEDRLYLGRQDADEFVYTPAGSNHPLCNSYYSNAAWDPSGYLALVACGDQVRLISLDGIVDVDLTPFLGLAMNGEAPRVFWGP